MRVWNNLSVNVKLVIAVAVSAALLTGTAVLIVQIQSVPAIRGIAADQVHRAVVDYQGYQRFADLLDRTTTSLVAHGRALTRATAADNAAEVAAAVEHTASTADGSVTLLVVNARGHVLFKSDPALSASALLRSVKAGGATPAWFESGNRLYELTAAPLVRPDGGRVGTLVRGRPTGDAVAQILEKVVSAPVVISFGGRVVGSSLSPAGMADWAKAADAAKPGPDVDVRLAGTLYVAGTVAAGPGIAPLITIMQPANGGRLLQSALRHLVLLLGASILLLGALLAWLIAFAVSRPIRMLLSGVRALEQGDFTCPLPPVGADEIGQLTAAFARMRATMERSRKDMLSAARLDALGQLAGSIAHDFNNLITVINGFSELMLEKLAPGDPNRRYLTQIRKAGDRAAGVTRELLIFSSHSVGDSCSLDLNTELDKSRGILKLLLGDMIELHIQLSLTPPRVYLDPAYFERIVVNLAANARDAMPNGGTLTVAVQCLQANPANPDRNGDWIQVSISDTGVGMSSEVQKRIFEPFFTTKDVGEGSGLGLATVYGIVKQAGGAILVDSAPGHGATFRIILPAETQAVVSAPAPDVADTPASRNSAPMPDPVSKYEQGSSQPTILLADDEPELRAMLKEALTTAGFAVVEAGDGVEALALATQLQWRFDALITDVAMPRLGGVELARQVRQQRPDMAVIYSSGFSERGVAAFESGSHYIAKPYAPDELVTLVRRLLGRALAAGA